MILKYFTDKKFLLGLGLGLIISALLLSSMPPKELSKNKVEEMAKSYGMIYPDNVKAFFSNDKK